MTMKHIHTKIIINLITILSLLCSNSLYSAEREIYTYTLAPNSRLKTLDSKPLPATLSWLETPDGEHKGLSERDGETDIDKIVKDIKENHKKKKFKFKLGKETHRRTIYIDSDQSVLGQRGLNTIIQNAVNKALDYCKRTMREIDILIPEELTIAFLDKSMHIAEDHSRNGFIGINKLIMHKQIVADIKKRFGPKAHNKLLEIIITHELIHELTGESNKIEADLFELDRKRMRERFGKSWFEDISEILGTVKELPEQIQSEQTPKHTEVTEYEDRKHIFVGNVYGNLMGLLEVLEESGLIKVNDNPSLTSSILMLKHKLYNEDTSFDDIWPELLYIVRNNLEWTGGNSILVQRGNIMYRGKYLDTTKYQLESVMLLCALKTLAQNENGDVILLLGYHELYYLLNKNENAKNNLIEFLVKHKFFQAIYKYRDLYVVHGGISKKLEESFGLDNKTQVTEEINRLFYDTYKTTKYDSPRNSGTIYDLTDGIFGRLYSREKDSDPLQISSKIPFLDIITSNRRTLQPTQRQLEDYDKKTIGSLGYLIGSTDARVLEWHLSDRSTGRKKLRILCKHFTKVEKGRSKSEEIPFKLVEATKISSLRIEVEVLYNPGYYFFPVPISMLRLNSTLKQPAYESSYEIILSKEEWCVLKVIRAILIKKEITGSTSDDSPSPSDTSL